MGHTQKASFLLSKLEDTTLTQDEDGRLFEKIWSWAPQEKIEVITRENKRDKWNERRIDSIRLGGRTK